MPNDLIVIKQLPVIEEQLQQIKSSVEQRVADVLSMVCDEATYKEVKNERAELNKEFSELEARRKEVKKAILAPYEAFEKLYKECVSDAYTMADSELKRKISDVEDGIKGRRRDEVVAFFNEYRTSRNIPEDLITFDDANIKIGMNDSPKKLRERAAEFLDGVADDLSLIKTIPASDEVLVEYYKTHNAAQAAMIVNERHKRLEFVAQQKAEKAAKQAAQEEARAKITELLNSEVVPITAPIEEQTVAPVAEKTYFISFRVRGTIDQLKALKKYLEDGGYSYEQFQ